jgi:hypothetical protein
MVLCYLIADRISKYTYLDWIVDVIWRPAIQEDGVAPVLVFFKVNRLLGRRVILDEPVQNTLV